MYVILRYAVQHFSYYDESSEANNNLVPAFRPSWMIDNACNKDCQRTCERFILIKYDSFRQKDKQVQQPRYCNPSRNAQGQVRSPTHRQCLTLHK